MDKTKRLLSFLNQFELGHYENINPILKELFPYTNNDSDYNSYRAYVSQVEGFLNALRKEGLIEVRKEGNFGARMGGKNILLDDGAIKAAITCSGRQSLKDDYPPIVQNIGTNYNIAAQGSEINLRDIQSVTNPTENPTKQAAKEGIITAIGKYLFNNVIIVLIVGLLLAYLIFKFGWN